MDDFFKSLKENLDNRPEQPFREESWQRMERRLSKPERRPLVALPLWWILLPLLLSLGAASWFFVQWQKAERQMQQVKNPVIFSTDTIYHSKIIYETDTIYRTQIIRERIANSPLTALSKHLNSNTSTFQSFTATNGSIIDYINSNNGLPAAKLLSDASVSSTEPFRPVTMSAVTFLDGTINLLNAVPHPLSSVPVISSDYKLNNHIIARLTYALRPKNFSIGVGGGWLYPINENIEEQSGYETGIQATIHFSERLSLWAEARYFKLIYQTEKMDNALGVPNMETPNDDLIFQEANVAQPAFGYAAGMQYLFPTSKKWQPFIGLGYGSASLLPAEVIYEFEDPATSLEILLEQDVTHRYLINHQFIAKAGLSYTLLPQWAWQTEAVWQQNFDTNRPNLFNRLGVRTSLHYQFGN